MSATSGQVHVQEPIHENQFLWVEKYRPRRIQDCVLPDGLRKIFTEILNVGDIPNWTFSGPPGVGKTTVIQALAEEMNIPHYLINASKDGNIDKVRTDIEDYGSSTSFDGKRKLIILDEADNLSGPAQLALRGAIEHFASNCSFVLTCNFQNKILDAVSGSRCIPIEFKIPPAEIPKMMGAFHKRACYILTLEKVEFDKAVVAELIKKNFPDFRRIVGILQTHALSGKIDVGVLAQLKDVDLTELFKALKAKDFTAMRKWVAFNLDQDPVRLYRRIYDSAYDMVQPSDIPAMVLILADYMYKSAFVADKEINTVACLTQIMAEVNLK